MSPPPLFRHVRQIRKIGKIKATFSVCMSYVFALMTLARVGVGEGGEWVRGERRRHAATLRRRLSSRVCFHVVSSQIRRNETRARQAAAAAAARR